MLFSYGPVTHHHILLRGQSFKTNRPSHMEFVGTDSDFGAQSIFETVGKLGRGVHHDRARIHFTNKTITIRLVLGNNGIGMIAIVSESTAQDVLDRLSAMKEKAFIIGEIAERKESAPRIRWV